MRKYLARPFLVTKALQTDGSFAGYGSVFDVVDAYGDVVIKGAFANSLASKMGTPQWPRMLWQHKSTEPIGVWTTMREDDKGLYCEGKFNLEMAGSIPANPTAWRAYSDLKQGSLSGLSIGFDFVPGGYEYDPNRDAYILKQVDLWEVSIVTFPANEVAQIDTIKSAITSPKDFERMAREGGLPPMTRAAARALMARGFKGFVASRDAEGDDEAEGLDSSRDADAESLKELSESIRSFTQSIKG